MSLRIIGIDLAVTAKHKAAILDPATNTFLARAVHFRALPTELERLLAKARQGVAADTRLVAVMEATGMAWYPVGVYLHHQGVAVYRVNGRQTRRLRQVYWQHARSDRIDADVLTRLYQLAPECLSLWTPPTGDQLTLQRLCREFARWREWDVAIQNRLSAYDQWAWGGLDHLVPAEALTWVRRHWYDPWQVLAAGVTTLQDAWRDAAPHPPTDLDWIARWVQRAELLTQLYGSQHMVDYPGLQAAIRRNLDLLRQSREMQQELSQAYIQPLYRQLYPGCPLESIPGIGANSAAIYMAFIHSIERFPTIQAFRKWCGIVPSSDQSGKAQSKGLRLTQAGPNLIKATLYQNANVARQWDVQIARIYHTQMVHYGKHHTQAVCACASHLASRIYAVLKENRPYALRDLDGRPISKAHSRQLIQAHFQVPEEVRRRSNIRMRREHQRLYAELTDPAP